MLALLLLPFGSGPGGGGSLAPGGGAPLLSRAPRGSDWTPPQPWGPAVSAEPCARPFHRPEAPSACGPAPPSLNKRPRLFEILVVSPRGVRALRTASLGGGAGARPVAPSCLSAQGNSAPTLATGTRTLSAPYPVHAPRPPTPARGTGSFWNAGGYSGTGVMSSTSRTGFSEPHDGDAAGPRVTAWRQSRRPDRHPGLLIARAPARSPPTPHPQHPIRAARRLCVPLRAAALHTAGGGDHGPFHTIPAPARLTASQPRLSRKKRCLFLKKKTEGVSHLLLCVSQKNR